MVQLRRVLLIQTILVAFCCFAAGAASASGTTLNAPPSWKEKGSDARGKADKQADKLEKKMKTAKAKKADKIAKAKKSKKAVEHDRNKKAKTQHEIKERSNARRELTKEEREQIRAEEDPGFFGRMRRFFGRDRSAERKSGDGVD